MANHEPWRASSLQVFIPNKDLPLFQAEGNNSSVKSTAKVTGWRLEPADCWRSMPHRWSPLRYSKAVAEITPLFIHSFTIPYIKETTLLLIYLIISCKLRFPTLKNHHHFVSSLPDVVLPNCNFHVFKMWCTVLWDCWCKAVYTPWTPISFFFFCYIVEIFEGTI